MKNPAPSGFDASLTKAIRAHGALRAHVYHFARLPAKVAARTPLEVVALSGAEVVHNIQRDDMTAHARTLALRGVGPEEAHRIAQRFFDEYPDFQPDMARLMTREMLLESFGPSIGEMLARVVVEPKDNPVVYELLFGGHAGEPVFTTVERDCIEANFSAQVVTNSKGVTVFGEWELRDSKPLPPHEASYLYEKYTGGTLQRIVVACNNEEFRHAVVCYPRR